MNYLLNHRLQWGKPDTLSVLPSAFRDEPDNRTRGSDANVPPPYFTSDTPDKYVSIIQNDWPYLGTSLSSDNLHRIVFLENL